MKKIPNTDDKMIGGGNLKKTEKPLPKNRESMVGLVFCCCFFFFLFFFC